jgi:hypothetical protein
MWQETGEDCMMRSFLIRCVEFYSGDQTKEDEMAVSFEHGNETYDSRKDGKFLD